MTTETPSTNEQTDNSAKASEIEAVTPEAPEQNETDEPAVVKARNEAARFRLRLRETEAERDNLAKSVDNLRRSVIENQVQAEGIKPAALWASGITPSDLLGDDGNIDPELISQAVNEARESLGIARFTGMADQGYKDPGPEKRSPSWSNLLQPLN